MALVVADRLQETTTTTGTGTYTLAGAKSGFASFASIGDGNTTYYACSDGTDFEVGIGTYTASGTTLARTTILSSSNSNNAVNWGAGDKDIFVTLPSAKSVLEDASNNVTTGGTVNGRNLSTDGTKLDGIAASANAYVHPNHSGEVTSTADGATVIADNIVDEANLKVSNTPTDGYFLSAQSGNTGGLTWAAVALPNQSLDITSSPTFSNLTVTNTVTANTFNATSDATLKTNISQIENPLAILEKITGVSFDWKNNEGSAEGVLAQDVEQVLPNAVMTDEKGKKSVSYNNLVGVLIEAVKGQQKQINNLKARLNGLSS